MCWKPKPQPITPASKRALLFGINKYGGQNNLSGCINDINDVADKLNKEFPGFDIRKYKDSEVTCDRFYDVVSESLSVMNAGDILYIHYSGHGCQIPNSQEVNGYDEALYLYDGPLVDDRIQELQRMTPAGALVSLKLDSCFSANMLRNITVGIKNPAYRKSKFVQLPDMPHGNIAVNKIGRQIADTWVVLSGCDEEQTSSDASFNGRPNGAFTYYDNKSYGPNTLWKDEVIKVHELLHSNHFEQNPELSGAENRFGNKVYL